MSALTEFLLARIAEDEAWAKHRDIVTFGCDDSRMSPARVLADLEAKRRIVAQASFWEAEPVGRTLDYVARVLALPHADHPDYREEWKP